MANISNTSRNTVLTGSSSADSVYNYARNVTINAGGGSDTVRTYGNSVSVFGGNGNDSIISTGGSYVTLHGGAGNDTLTGSSAAEVFQFRSDGGNDVITNFNSNDILYIAAGKLDSYYVDGDDLIVRAKGTSYSGTIRLKNAADREIKVKVGNDMVQTLSSIKSITNTTRNTIISSTSGADSINNRARNVTINAGKGDDTIQTYGNSVLVNGGTGNDSIISTGGSYVTLHGGAGNDTLTGSSAAEVFQFRSDGGNDVITNFNSNDTLHIAAGKLDSYYVDGDDLIVRAKGTSYSGTIRLKNAADREIKVKVGSDSVQTINSINYIYNDQYDTIVSGSAVRDYIDNTHSDVTINGGAGNDTVDSHGASYNVYRFASDGGHDLIKSFDANYDWLQITAGSINTYQYVDNNVIVSVKGARYSGTVTLEGVGDAPVRILNAKGTPTQVLAPYPLTVNGNDVIMNMDSALINAGSGNDFVNLYGFSSTVDGGAGNDSIYSHEGRHSLNGGSGNDLIYGSGEIFTTIRGGSGNDTIDIGGDYRTYQFGSADGHDTIYSYSTDDVLQITAGSLASHYAAGDDYVVEVKGVNYSGSVTFKNAAVTPIKIRANGRTSTINVLDPIENDNDNTVIGGTSKRDVIYNSGQFVTINAGNDADYISNSAQNVVINGGNGKDYIVSDILNGEYRDVTVNAGAGDDTVYMNDGYHSINGGAGNDYIYGYYRNSTVDGGAGNDTVYHGNSHGNYMYVDLGAGNDYIYGDVDNSTIRGGAGNDTITDADGLSLVYRFGSSDGRDLITNFNSESDKLQIYSGSITNHYASGSDYVVQVGSSASVTLQGRASDQIEVMLANGSSTVLNGESNSELASSIEDYWFTQEEASLDEIDRIMSSENNFVGLEFDPNDQFKAASIDLVDASARIRDKKGSASALST